MLSTKELMTALISGKELIDIKDFDPGLSSHGGRYSFTYRLDSSYRLWVLCSYEDSTWEQISENLAESWGLLKGVNWDEEATWINAFRWQIW